MKYSRFVAVLVLLVVLVLPVSASAGNSNFQVNLKYGNTASSSTVKISSLPIFPSTLAVREQSGWITWEQQISVTKTPFYFSNDESDGLTTQYIGLNAVNGTYFSSTWDSNVCPGGVTINVSGNGKTMKVKIANPGNVPLTIVGVGGLRTVVRPGKTVSVSGNLQSGGFGVLTLENSYCASASWNFTNN